MKKRSGIIYQMDNGKYGLAIYAEQHQSFRRIRKVCLEYFHDAKCTQPVTNDEGKRVVGLKSMDKLKIVGFVD